MAGSEGGVVVHLDEVRAVRLPDFDSRSRNITAAFVAAATAEIPRAALARALVLIGLRIIAEGEGLLAAGEHAREILAGLARDPAG